jgi:hypothetical protein
VAYVDVTGVRDSLSIPLYGFAHRDVYRVLKVGKYRLSIPLYGFTTKTSHGLY